MQHTLLRLPTILTYVLTYLILLPTPLLGINTNKGQIESKSEHPTQQTNLTEQCNACPSSCPPSPEFTPWAGRIL
ncbi:hypothetical protein J3F83DRAFT_734885 [Trichoderma novae-zelandiae]